MHVSYVRDRDRLAVNLQQGSTCQVVHVSASVTYPTKCDCIPVSMARRYGRPPWPTSSRWYLISGTICCRKATCQLPRENEMYCPEDSPSLRSIGTLHRLERSALHLRDVLIILEHLPFGVVIVPVISEGMRDWSSTLVILRCNSSRATGVTWSDLPATSRRAMCACGIHEC